MIGRGFISGTHSHRPPSPCKVVYVRPNGEKLVCDHPEHDDPGPAPVLAKWLRARLNW